MLTHRGIKIYQKTKVVNHENPVSGHSWSTYKPVNKWYCDTHNTGITSFEGSIKKCKEHIDFCIKFPWKPPITRREILKGRKLGLIK